MNEITLHTLIYSKADMDNAPREERIFYLMATSVANDTQMLNKTRALVLEKNDLKHRIINKGNIAFGAIIYLT